MGEKISKIQYLIISLIAGITLFFNFWSWHNPIIGLAFGLGYILFYSFIAGSIFVKRLNWPQNRDLPSAAGWQVIFGLLFLLSLIAIFGALAIYFLQFNDYFFALLIILIPALLFIPYYYITPREKFSLKKIILDHFDKILSRREPKFNIILVFTYLTSAVIGFLLLATGRTSESIQSPWQTVPAIFLPVYFCATLILLTYVLRSRRTKLPLALIVIHTFLSTGVAAIVYRLGYGFDPFIHQATEKIIAQTGTITPKPLYYLGQYALVVFLNKLTLLNISTVDKFLVPVLTALTLPTTTYFVFRHWLNRHYALVLALTILVIPFPYFIMTAPQNLANLFFIITILLSVLYFRGDIKIKALYLLALTTAVIHPLAGIPLLITVFLFNLFKVLFDSYRHYLSLFFLPALIFIFALPLAFTLNGSATALNYPDFKLSSLNFIHWVNKFDLPLNLAYIFQTNKIFIAIIVIAIGLIYLAKNKLLKNNAAYLIAAFVTFANYLIVRYLLTLPDLVSNDQADFVNRIKDLAFLTLLPIFLLGLYLVVKTLWQKDVFFKILLVGGGAGLITVSFYFSYPRFNQYEPAKFFSVSQSDFNAVRLIEGTAKPDHVVLANQMVGAAAIAEFGFKKYYDNQFYYSMPMGSPRTFYDSYLQMIYQGAQRQTMEKAMADAKVTEAYFVLNKYWNNSEKIAQQAGQSADKTYLVDNGQVYVFKYIANQ